MLRLSKQADAWIQSIQKQEPFTMKLDLYYLFLLVGLLAKNTSSIKEKGQDILDYFPEAYKKQQKLIINFLLISQKKMLGIPDDAKKRITSELLEKYVDSESNSLSLAGRSLCNEHANAGFEILRDTMPPPTDASAFLQACLKEINKLEANF